MGAYRLIGYENRMLAAEDFNDDTKDAGEIGAGHTVTALYEIVPVGRRPGRAGHRSAEVPAAPQPAGDAGNGELLTVKLRYKEPDGFASKLLSFPVRDDGGRIDWASDNLQWAAGVAAFGMLLRDSPYKGAVTYEMARSLAEAGRGADPSGRRGELVQLIETARNLTR